MAFYYIGSEHMKIKEEEYKQLCAKCEYLIKLPDRKICPFVGCIKREKGGNLDGKEIQD